MALKLKGSTSGFVALDSPSVAGNNTLILPENNGSAQQLLGNDITAGVVTFTSVTVNRNGDLTVPGTISIGGTLTYEDVTSVDSVGIVTARSGVRINGGGLTIIGNTTGINATGISTLSNVDAAGIVTARQGLRVNAGGLNVSGVSTFASDVHLSDSTKPSLALYTGTALRADLSATSGICSIRSYANNPFTINIGGSGETEALRITSAGKVGIGTNNPSKQLSIYGDSDTCIRVTAALGGAASLQLGDIDDTVKGAVTFLNSDNSLRIRGHNNNDRLIINSTGNAKFTGIVTATSFESTTFSKTPTNTPAFHAWSNNVTSHSWPEASLTKVEFLNSETLDTDSAYDNSTSGTTANRFTVPTGKGGYYQISAGLNFYANANDMRHARAVIKQNTDVKITAYGMVAGSSDGDLRHFQVNISGILQLADGDYIELFGYLDTNGNSQGYISNDANGYRGNHFSAYKLII